MPDASSQTSPTARADIASVCVYCGSGEGRLPAYVEAARTLGQTLARDGVRLVYGGGNLGMMGEVARATLAAGGQVTGVIPTFLSEREQMLREVQELIVTDDMHQRKMTMFMRADAFVAMPGGIGTLEELVEQLTWAQLGRHRKPVIVANIAGFWTPFLDLLRHMQAERFIRPGLDVTFLVVERVEEILPAARKAIAASPGPDTNAAEVVAKF
jgi:hypothetical protein